MINTKKGNARTANLEPCKVSSPQSATQPFLVSSRNAPPHKQFVQLVVIINNLFLTSPQYICGEYDRCMLPLMASKHQSIPLKSVPLKSRNWTFAIASLQ